MKHPIICFMGLDGSGKSTCVEYACELLRQKGVKVEIVRAAYVVKVMSFLIKIGKKLLLKKDSDPFGGDYQAYLHAMREKSQKGLAYRIFSLMTTLEFKAQIFFLVKVKHFQGTTLLLDRYIYDNAVTYAANLGKGGDFMRETIEKKWRNAPRPDLLLYIKTPVEVCCSRKDDIPDPLYLQIRQPLYDEIARMYCALVIPGDQEKQGMLQAVRDAVCKVMEFPDVIEKAK